MVAGKETLSLSLESWRLYLFAIIARLDFISWEDRRVCLVSKGENHLDWRVFSRRRLYMRIRLYGSFFFSHIYATEFLEPRRKNKTRKKRRRGDIVRSTAKPRINLSGVRDGAADYGNSEKWERARTDVRRNDGPLQKLLLSAWLRHSSSVLFARGVAYDGGCHRMSELALRSLACSRHLLFPGLFPGSLQTRRFFYRLLFGAHFSPTPHVSSDNVWRKSVMRMWMLR